MGRSPSCRSGTLKLHMPQRQLSISICSKSFKQMKYVPHCYVMSRSILIFPKGQIRLPHQRGWCNCVGTRTRNIRNFITLGCIQRQNTAHGAIQTRHHHRLVVRTFPVWKQHPGKEYHLLWVLPVCRESPSRLERNSFSRWGGKYHISHLEGLFSDEVVSLRSLC